MFTLTNDHENFRNRRHLDGDLDVISALPRTEAESRLFESMRRLVEDYARNPDPYYELMVCKYRYLLGNGRFFEPEEFPKGYRRGKRKQCFSEAQVLSLHHPELVYAEGIAVSSVVPLPVNHGWCVAEGERVVDPTWDEPGMINLGVVFDPERVRSHLRALTARRQVGAILTPDFFDPDIIDLGCGLYGRRGDKQV